MPAAPPRRFLADKGYDSDNIRETLFFQAVLPVIPPRSNRKKSIPYDIHVYRDRNHSERMFNTLKQFRRIATRYDKTRKSFLAFLNIAAMKIWIPAFVNKT
ncbi:transposase [Saccharibacter floricola]|uniref:transposase n=1 Tax=Saccharibacter floricola TaxID=231053 RepID=UPI002230BD1E|nr:transposase [Saccharibacter floricola]